MSKAHGSHRKSSTEDDSAPSSPGPRRSHRKGSNASSGADEGLAEQIAEMDVNQTEEGTPKKKKHKKKKRNSTATPIEENENE